VDHDHGKWPELARAQAGWWFCEPNLTARVPSERGHCCDAHHRHKMVVGARDPAGDEETWHWGEELDALAAGEDRGALGHLV
jgi:hypothetical protein